MSVSGAAFADRPSNVLFGERTEATCGGLRPDGWQAELVDPIHDGRWEAFVGRADNARVFHHRAWLALLRAVYGLPIAACCVIDRSGDIQGGVPIALVGRGLRRPRFTCLPLSDRCSPLPDPEDDPAMARRVLCALDDLVRRAGIPADVPGPVAWHPAVRVSARYRAHEIPLDPDVARVLRRVRPDALAAGLDAGDVVVERRTDAAALVEFHARLASKRRHGLAPVVPRRLIDGLAYLFDRGLGFVLLARRGGRLVGGAVFLTFNRTLRLQFAAGGPHGSDTDSQHLLLLEGIRWGCEAGMRTLDLGCTGFDRDDVRGFRRAWGAEERVLEIITLDDVPQPPHAATGRWVGRLVARRARTAGAILAPRGLT